MAHHSGVVRWFNNAKGYGFLGHEGGPDVFVHDTAIQDHGSKTFQEGQLVEFDIVQGSKGPPASQYVLSNCAVM